MSDKFSLDSDEEPPQSPTTYSLSDASLVVNPHVPAAPSYFYSLSPNPPASSPLSQQSAPPQQHQQSPTEQHSQIARDFTVVHAPGSLQQQQFQASPQLQGQQSQLISHNQLLPNSANPTGYREPQQQEGPPIFTQSFQPLFHQEQIHNFDVLSPVQKSIAPASAQSTTSLAPHCSQDDSVVASANPWLQNFVPSTGASPGSPIFTEPENHTLPDTAFSSHSAVNAVPTSSDSSAPSAWGISDRTSLSSSPFCTNHHQFTPKQFEHSPISVVGALYNESSLPLNSSAAEVNTTHQKQFHHPSQPFTSGAVPALPSSQPEFSQFISPQPVVTARATVDPVGPSNKQQEQHPMTATSFPIFSNTTSNIPFTSNRADKGTRKSFRYEDRSRRLYQPSITSAECQQQQSPPDGIVPTLNYILGLDSIPDNQSYGIRPKSRNTSQQYQHPLRLGSQPTYSRVEGDSCRNSVSVLPVQSNSQQQPSTKFPYNPQTYSSLQYSSQSHNGGSVANNGK